MIALAVLAAALIGSAGGVIAGLALAVHLLTPSTPPAPHDHRKSPAPGL